MEDDKALIIEEVERLMSPALGPSQMQRLHVVLSHCLIDKDNFPAPSCRGSDNLQLITDFLSAKRLEGCSERSIAYYETTLRRFVGSMGKPLQDIRTDEIRSYLSEHQSNSGISNVTVDNIRRVISSLFSWLESEGIVYKSPVRRIRKIRTAKTVKPVINDESMERLRDNCPTIRDLAMIDILSSTGMRVGELERLNRSDIDFEGRECIVHGKGSKERRVYFDARTKVHLQSYLASRDDEDPALFVSLYAPHGRLRISGIETRLRKLGKSVELSGIHPHKFRRTLATKAIDKGMPIEQVQVLLGHSKIDTTLCYAMVDEQNVKQSHRKFIC